MYLKGTDIFSGEETQSKLFCLAFKNGSYLKRKNLHQLDLISEVLKKGLCQNYFASLSKRGQF